MSLEQAFGAVIRRLRHANDFSQEALAYSANVDRSYLSELENGHRSPSLAVIFRLASALSIPPRDLIEAVEHELSGD